MESVKYSDFTNFSTKLTQVVALLLILESTFWVVFGLLDAAMPVSEAHAGVFAFLTLLEALSVFALYSVIRKRPLGLPIYSVCCTLPYVLAHQWDFTMGGYTFGTLVSLLLCMLSGGDKSYFKQIYAKE